MKYYATLAAMIVLLSATPFPSAAHGFCTHGPLTHTYVLGGSVGVSNAKNVGRTFVFAEDSNVADCNGDGVLADYDGDPDVGVGGGAFGYGPYAAFCRHDATGGNYLVSDVMGWPITFWVGADDESGPLVPGTCITDGVIDPFDPDDCFHGPYVTSASASPCTGGSDGLIWIFIAGVGADARPLTVSNVPTVGLIMSY